MADHLKSRTPGDVAAFYRRLATHIETQFGGKSLAAELLLHWLDGKGAKKDVDPDYLSGVSFVEDYLQTEVRPVFLTEKKARLRGGEKWGGIIPRLNRIPPYDKPEIDKHGLYLMSYEGPSVEIPLSVQAKALLGANVAPRELDLLYALHRFGLVTQVRIFAVPIPASTKVSVTFAPWLTKMKDRYDWDSSKHITVPNPDFGSKVPGAVAPGEKKIEVHHSNAKRVEAANLAAPFDIESKEWTPKRGTIWMPAAVDVARCRASGSDVYCSGP